MSRRFRRSDSLGEFISSKNLEIASEEGRGGRRGDVVGESLMAQEASLLYLDEEVEVEAEY